MSLSRYPPQNLQFNSFYQDQSDQSILLLKTTKFQSSKIPYSIPFSDYQNNQYFFNDNNSFEKEDLFAHFDEQQYQFQVKSNQILLKQQFEEKLKEQSIILEEKKKQNPHKKKFNKKTNQNKQNRTLRTKKDISTGIKSSIQLYNDLQDNQQKNKLYFQDDTEDLNNLIHDQYEKIPRKSKGKGLKKLSQTVYEIVSTLINTSFKQVADILIRKLVTDKFNLLNSNKIPNSIILKAEHNVKRRAYDALNVLIATGLCSKNGKVVSSVIPYRSENFIKNQLIKKQIGIDQEQLNKQIDLKQKTLKQKRQRKQYLQKQKQSIQNLIQRNKYREKQLKIIPQDPIPIPFLCAIVDEKSKQIRQQVINKNDIVNESLILKSDKLYSLNGQIAILMQFDPTLISQTAQLRAKQYYEKYCVKKIEQKKQKINNNIKNILPLEEFKTLLDKQIQLKKQFIDSDDNNAFQNIALILSKSYSLKEKKENEKILQKNKKITDYFQKVKKEDQIDKIKQQSPKTQINQKYDKEDQTTQSRYSQTSQSVVYVPVEENKFIQWRKSRFSFNNQLNFLNFNDLLKVQDIKVEQKVVNKNKKVKQKSSNKSNKVKNVEENDSKFSKWFSINKKIK